MSDNTITRIVVDIAMEDGTEHRGVKTAVVDRLAYSRMARKHSWPALHEDFDLALTYLAWHAANRQGLYPGDWGQFVNEAAAVDPAGDMGVEDVDPYQSMTPSA